MKLIYFFIASLLLATAFADVYYADGSNNRLNERTATRTNNNRLFNSQNNARGGRNVGEYTADGTGQEISIAYNPNEPDAHQYPMTYFEGSEFIMAWTSQHGCGGNPSNDPHNDHCNIILQYTCKAKHSDPALDTRYLRNGANTGTPQTNNDLNSIEPQNDAGYHENTRYYRECQLRQRDPGIFTATQNLNGDTDIYTRQNPGGNRSGLECEAERDYYPFPRPSIWRDIAYLSSEIGNTNIDICNLVQTESQNVKAKHRCTGTEDKHFRPITQEECEDVGGTWTETPPWGLDAPNCLQSEWTRDNHLGNTREGQYHNYTWVLPTIEDALRGTAEDASSVDLVECVARVRYNITTGDYDPWNTFADSNGAESPVKNNPTVDLGVDPQGLNIALNTAQTGRTFQDRSHVFTIRRRAGPVADPSTVVKNIYTLGKRGNIVQTYPGTEYYQMPANLTMNVNDFFYISWTGSNTHNNQAPGGDGQTGDDGQGQGGTDRQNFLLTYGEGYNWPIPLDKDDDTLFDHSDCWRVSGAKTITPLTRNECAITLATAGYYTSVNTGTGTAMDVQMNNARPSLIGGILIRPKKAGKYTYFCSRNNNFTNRSQKGVINVV